MIEKKKDKEENMKKFAFMLKCSNCKSITGHSFIEFEDSDNRLKCPNCNHIGYILKEDFDDFYINGDVGLMDLKFEKI